MPEPDGTVKHVPFHSYTMKQAIQEGFIVDVLAHYMPVQSYYRLTKTVEGDPRFDTLKAQRKLRRYVESHDHAVRLKAEIMVDHFHGQVRGQRKSGGLARAMVVTDGVERAIQYHQAISGYLAERRSPHRALVAFSGEREHRGATVSEASLNGFPSIRIAQRFQQEPYRFLICADKFQTGYDEPLLHTMYVDKILSGIKAVQTLSRLNRAHPDKHDAFVLDFTNDADIIREAFEPYYRSTVLADETDPDKLHDIVADLDGHQVYTQHQVDSFVEAFLDGVTRDRLDPILDECVAAYLSDLAEDRQVDFKGNAKAFLRTYGFLGAVLPYGYPEWGEAVDLPELLGAEATRTPRGRPVERRARDRRHGQLSSGEAAGHPDRLSRQKTARSTPFRQEEAVTSPNHSWTICPTSSRRSTSHSATSSGKTTTACSVSSPRRSLRRSTPTRPTATPASTPMNRTPASSTTAPSAR